MSSKIVNIQMNPQTNDHQIDQMLLNLPKDGESELIIDYQQTDHPQELSTNYVNNVITSTTVNSSGSDSQKLVNSNSEKEELLGSVRTYLTDVTTVRTSARVIHKLREISSASASPQTEKKDNQEQLVNTPKTPSQTKTPHVKVQWINAEKNYFYDALNEYGRDFEKISHFINMKMRRKSSSDADYKTKDQVRTFYYQLYNKASKYLRFSSDVMKTAQELYTVINYGEMKRKLVIMTDKSFIKLRELVYRGSTVIRMKGRNIRIKTPPCRALRKLNQLEGIDEEVLLPHRIDLVIRPGSMKSWGYVQSLAQNPRIKMLSLPLQKRLASVLASIQQKWQTDNIRLYDRYITSCVQRQGNQKVGEVIMTQSQNDVIQLKQEEPVLRLIPPKDTPIHRPLIQLNELLSSDYLCLNSYEERIGATIRGEPLCLERLVHIKDLQRNSTKRARNDSTSEKPFKIMKIENEVKTTEMNSTIQTELMETGISVIDHKNNELSHSKKNDTNSATFLSQVKNGENFSYGNTQMLQVHSKIEAATKAEQTVSKHTTSAKKKKDALQIFKITKQQQLQNYKPLIDEESVRQVRQGWTLENVGDVTIGDLYLMLGTDCRLTLEYEISPAKPIANEDDLKIGRKLKSLVAIATLMEGGSNPILSNFFSKHACEKATGDQKPMDFKLPKTELYHRLTARKLHPARLWQQRPRAPVSIPGNHVIRDLYEKQRTNVVNNRNMPLNEQQTINEEDVQKIIEDKIQDISDNVNSYPESSRSSMRSLLDCLTLNNGTVDDLNNEESSFSMKLIEAENVCHVYDSMDDISNISLSGLFCQLEKKK